VKLGDNVYCIDVDKIPPQGATLELHEIYTIKQIHEDNYLELNEVPAFWKVDRFIKPGDKVVCVESKFDKATPKPLITGEIYTVVNITMSPTGAGAYFQEQGSIFWLLSRFKKVPNEPDNCVCSNNQLLWGGCKCGFFQKEQRNKV
jgi:hypothetical protein